MADFKDSQEGAEFRACGRLVREVERTEMANSTSFRGSIAVDRYQGKGRETATDFFDFSTYKEFVGERMLRARKGEWVEVIGHLHTYKRGDGGTGLDVRVEKFRQITWGDRDEQRQASPAPAKRRAEPAAVGADEDDLPF